jgi:hypothetical protein
MQKFGEGSQELGLSKRDEVGGVGKRTGLSKRDEVGDVGKRTTRRSSGAILLVEIESDFIFPFF